jgi:pSer/pThr/pTyr-binding forkhead associated (FHA) protein
VSRRLIVDDGRSKRELLLVGRLIVGRDPACEISHGDPRLSRRHAELDVTPEGVRVRDLQSRNGIRVNGEAVDEALLKPGDSVQIAHLVLQFVEGDAAAAAAATRPGSRPEYPLAVTEPMSDDDRTRVLAATGAAVRAGRVVVRDGLLDERTVNAAPPSSIAPLPPTGPSPVPDLADMTIRRGGTVAIARPGSGEYLGVQWLARRAWGRRVLLQGLLLALVVACVTTIPLLAWQARTFGVTAVSSVAVLAPALIAGVFAGLMVASLIARTTAKGLGKDR